MPLKLDYYYGDEAEQFSFYRVPKLLFTDRRFSGVSVEAKVLYGIMLDRMALSVKSGWLDEQRRVYIIFKVTDVMETLGCAAQKANKLMGELDTVRGIGLIERVRRGLGRPNVIYVKNFIGGQEPGGGREPELEQELRNRPEQNQEWKLCKEGVPDESGTGHDDSEDHKSKMMKIKNPEMRKSQIQNDENQKSGIVKITSLDFRLSQTSNTERNDTELNETDLSIYPLPEERGKTDCGDTIGGGRVLAVGGTGAGCTRLHVDSARMVRSPTADPDQSPEGRRAKNNGTVTFDDIDPETVLTLRYAKPVQEVKISDDDPLEPYRELVRESISYEILLSEKPYDKDRLDGIVELIAETCWSRRAVIRVNQTDMPAEAVRSRLLKLEIGHIRYVMECMDRSTAQIGNIKAYLLSALYNAPVTIRQYYASRVQCDMAAVCGGG